MPNTTYHITASTTIKNCSVYISNNDEESGYSSTLWARPYPHYIFRQWNDGNTSNPRTLTVTSDVTLVAEYEHELENNTVYKYRCYVKDQLYLTDPPKSFMDVKSFSISNDLLTTANSTIEVYELDDAINNGDILIIYSPTGTIVYQGVIYSMSGTTIQCHQMQNFYAGTWLYTTNSQSYLEDEIRLILKDYADGKIKSSNYTDPLVAKRLGGITIQSVQSLTSSLPSASEDFEQRDMEEFIYSLYEDYGIIFDFEINFSGANYVRIKVPTYTSIKVGNNNYAIQDLSPVTQIEETNKLIIYASNGTYRTTYVATNNGNVEAPTSLVGRFNITNTKIVASDDEISDLVSSYLPSTMYNHKVTFTLVLQNSLYTFDEFKLGMPLDIWDGTDYYSSVLTGYTLEKEENTNPTVVDYTCGKVRTALTKKLSMGVINNVR